MTVPITTFPFDDWKETDPAIFNKTWCAFWERLNDALDEVIEWVEINAIFDE